MMFFKAAIQVQSTALSEDHEIKHFYCLDQYSIVLDDEITLLTRQCVLQVTEVCCTKHGPALPKTMAPSTRS